MAHVRVRAISAEPLPAGSLCGRPAPSGEQTSSALALRSPGSTPPPLSPLLTPTLSVRPGAAGLGARGTGPSGFLTGRRGNSLFE